jgi:putative ABC transport system permease protein
MIAWLLAKTRLAPLAIPLASIQLGANPWRFLAALMGIMAASTLMLFVFSVFKCFLEDMNNRPAVALSADLFMVSRNSEALDIGLTFPRTRLFQALAVPEVARVASLRVATGSCQFASGQLMEPIQVYGVDTSEPMFDLPSFGMKNEFLKVGETALFDGKSHPKFAPILERLRNHADTQVNLNGRRLRIAGTFGLGQTLDSGGCLIMGLPVFAHYFPNENPNYLSLGTIKLQPGTDPVAVAENLNRILPQDVTVLTKQRMLDRETAYTKHETPLGFVMYLMLTATAVTGAIIIYQILYADVTEHIKEYATLKAIGHSDLFLNMIIFKQGGILAILGYLPGAALTAMFCKIMREHNNMPMSLGSGILALVFIMDLGICMLAGFLATRSLRRADPADTF